jgi:hypothetical protein
MTTKGELIDQLHYEELLWLDRTDARDAIETVLGHVIATAVFDDHFAAMAGAGAND